jgi:hypothetical protein
VVANEEAFYKCLEELNSATHEVTAASAQGADHVPTHGTLLGLVFRMNYV